MDISGSDVSMPGSTISSAPFQMAAAGPTLPPGAGGVVRTYQAAQGYDLRTEYNVLKQWAVQHDTAYGEAQQRLGLAERQAAHLASLVHNGGTFGTRE